MKGGAGVPLCVWLALTVGVGSLLASCSEGAARKSCRDTCVGCCAAEVCVPTSRQDFAQCGVNGGQCRACLPGELCSTVGTCLPDPTAKDAGSDCGLRGQICCLIGAGCYAGLICTSGVCDVSSTPPDAGRPDASGAGAGVGSPCADGAQCQFNFCAKTRFPAGYCSRTCASNQDCPLGSTCSLDPGDTTGLSRVCLAACTSAGTAPGDCRAGYVCDKKGTSLDGTPVCTSGCAGPADCRGGSACDGRGFCCGLEGYACCEGSTCAANHTCLGGYCKANPPPPPPDGGALKPNGSACTAGSECLNGLCSKQAPAGTEACPAAACWPLGYCTQQCNGGGCDPSSSCSPYFPPTGLVSLCLKNCSFDGGQGDCRPSYICDRFWIPSSTQATCVYGCLTHQDCPAQTQCNPASHFCCGKTSYACCPGASCPFGGTCGTLGYCE
jgi:hypothetical protein